MTLDADTSAAEESFPRVLDDLPAQDDLCGFLPLTNEILQLVYGWSQTTPYPFTSALVLAINGQWGAGKTTLALQVRKNLSSQSHFDAETDKSFFFNWIDISVWKYPEKPAFLRALLTAVLERLSERVATLEIRDQPARSLCEVYKVPADHMPSDMRQPDGDITIADLVEHLEKSLYRATHSTVVAGGRVNWGNALADVAGVSLVPQDTPIVGKVAQGAKRALNAKIAKSRLEQPAADDELYETREREIAFEEVRSAEQFERLFRLAVAILCCLPPANKLEKKVSGRLLFCIDDLDRCLPENTVTILETLKLLLDSPYCCYLVPVDPMIVDAGLAARYAAQGRSSAWFPDYRDYLDKIFHQRIELEHLSIQQIQSFLPTLLATCLKGGYRLNQQEIDQLAEALAVVCPNPRRIKHVLRAVSLNSHAQASFNNLLSEVYRLGFDLECGRKYPALQRFPDLLPDLHKLLTGEKRDWEEAAKSLKHYGIDEHCLEQILLDWRLRNLLDRISAHDRFELIRRSLQNGDQDNH